MRRQPADVKTIAVSCKSQIPPRGSHPLVGAGNWEGFLAGRRQSDKQAADVVFIESFTGWRRRRAL